MQNGTDCTSAYLMKHYNFLGLFNKTVLYFDNVQVAVPS